MGSVRGGVEDGAEVTLAFSLPVDDAGRIDAVLHIAGCAVVCTFASSSARFNIVERASRVGGLRGLGVTKFEGTMDERGGRRWRLRMCV